jgi:hypothetical protein
MAETAIDMRPIPGFEGQYAASADGRVFSMNYRGMAGRVRELAQARHPEGYMRVKAAGIRKGSPTPVHRLVALAFHPNPGGLPQVNHINGNKSDNRAENLEWVTNARNQQHAHEIGIKVAKQGVEHHAAVINEAIAAEVKRALRRGDTTREIVGALGVSKYIVHDIRRQKTWRHVCV